MERGATGRYRTVRYEVLHDTTRHGTVRCDTTRFGTSLQVAVSLHRQRQRAVARGGEHVHVAALRGEQQPHQLDIAALHRVVQRRRPGRVRRVRVEEGRCLRCGRENGRGRRAPPRDAAGHAVVVVRRVCARGRCRSASCGADRCGDAIRGGFERRRRRGDVSRGGFDLLAFARLLGLDALDPLREPLPALVPRLVRLLRHPERRARRHAADPQQ